MCVCVCVLVCVIGDSGGMLQCSVLICEHCVAVFAACLIEVFVMIMNACSASFESFAI